MQPVVAMAATLVAMVMYVATSSNQGNSLVSCTACQSIQVKHWNCEVSCSEDQGGKISGAEIPIDVLLKG